MQAQDYELFITTVIVNPYTVSGFEYCFSFLKVQQLEQRQAVSDLPALCCGVCSCCATSEHCALHLSSVPNSSFLLSSL